MWTSANVCFVKLLLLTKGFFCTDLAESLIHECNEMLPDQDFTRSMYMGRINVHTPSLIVIAPLYVPKCQKSSKTNVNDP